MFRYYQKVIALKKSEAFTYGGVKEYDRKNRRVICYEREYRGERYLVFGNFSGRTVKYALPAEFKGAGETVLSNYDGQQVHNGVYTLRPYEAVVIK